MSDNVAIFSRGRVVEMLSDDRVTEDNITSAVLKSTQQRDKHDRSIGAFWKWAAGNTAPLIMVATAIILLGAVAGAWNPFYLSTRSLSNMMTLAATLAFVAYGQQFLMLVSGIDLSVGPTMGLVQVVASFFILSDAGDCVAHDWMGTGIYRCDGCGIGKLVSSRRLALTPNGRNVGNIHVGSGRIFAPKTSAKRHARLASYGGNKY